ncbi:hypothetical protein GCM10027191_09220 [Novilysobacter erysipheiresistens]
MSEKQQPDPWPFVWLRNGAFSAWFAWIEWLGLTAALIAASLKTKGSLVGLPIAVLAILSTWFVFCSGIAGFTDFLATRLAGLGISSTLHRLVGIVASGVITCAVLWSLVSAIMALLPGGA